MNLDWIFFSFRPFTKIPSVMISVVGSWSVSSGSEDFYVWIHKVTPTEVTVKVQGDLNQEIDIEYMACVNLNL